MEEIKFHSETFRPCLIKTTGEKGIFHRWVDGTATTLALVELEDGNVAEVNPVNIQFLDSEIRWSGYYEIHCDPAMLDVESLDILKQEIAKEEQEYKDLKRIVSAARIKGVI